MPEHNRETSVVYRAVADFSSLFAQVELAKVALKSLKDEQRTSNLGQSGAQLQQYKSLLGDLNKANSAFSVPQGMKDALKLQQDLNAELATSRQHYSELSRLAASTPVVRPAVQSAVVRDAARASTAGTVLNRLAHDERGAISVGTALPGSQQLAQRLEQRQQVRQSQPSQLTTMDRLKAGIQELMHSDRGSMNIGGNESDALNQRVRDYDQLIARAQAQVKNLQSQQSGAASSGALQRAQVAADRLVRMQQDLQQRATEAAAREQASGALAASAPTVTPAAPAPAAPAPAAPAARPTPIARPKPAVQPLSPEARAAQEAASSPSIVDRNIAQLREGGYPESMVGNYQKALERDARLADVPFKQMQGTGAGMTRPGENGVPELHLPPTSQAMQKALSDRLEIPGARERFADHLGTTPDKLSLEQMQSHVMLHELGHARDAMSDPNYGDKVRASYGSLPIANTPTFQLMDPNNKKRQELERSLFLGNVPEHKDMTSILRAQEEAYRNTPVEHAADDWSIAQLNPSHPRVSGISAPKVEEAPAKPVMEAPAKPAVAAPAAPAVGVPKEPYHTGAPDPYPYKNANGSRYSNTQDWIGSEAHQALPKDERWMQFDPRSEKEWRGSTYSNSSDRYPYETVGTQYPAGRLGPEGVREYDPHERMQNALGSYGAKRTPENLANRNQALSDYYHASGADSNALRTMELESGLSKSTLRKVVKETAPSQIQLPPIEKAAAKVEEEQKQLEEVKSAEADIAKEAERIVADKPASPAKKPITKRTQLPKASPAPIEKAVKNVENEAKALDGVAAAKGAVAKDAKELAADQTKQQFHLEKLEQNVIEYRRRLAEAQDLEDKTAEAMDSAGVRMGSGSKEENAFKSARQGSADALRSKMAAEKQLTDYQRRNNLPLQMPAEDTITGDELTAGKGMVSVEDVKPAAEVEKAVTAADKSTNTQAKRLKQVAKKQKAVEAAAEKASSPTPISDELHIIASDEGKAAFADLIGNDPVSLPSVPSVPEPVKPVRRVEPLAEPKAVTRTRQKQDVAQLLKAAEEEVRSTGPSYDEAAVQQMAAQVVDVQGARAALEQLSKDIKEARQALAGAKGDQAAKGEAIQSAVSRGMGVGSPEFTRQLGQYKAMVKETAAAERDLETAQKSVNAIQDSKRSMSGYRELSDAKAAAGQIRENIKLLQQQRDEASHGLGASTVAGDPAGMAKHAEEEKQKIEELAKAESDLEHATRRVSQAEEDAVKLRTRSAGQRSDVNDAESALKRLQTRMQVLRENVKLSVKDDDVVQAEREVARLKTALRDLPDARGTVSLTRSNAGLSAASPLVDGSRAAEQEARAVLADVEAWKKDTAAKQEAAAANTRTTATGRAVETGLQRVASAVAHTAERWRVLKEAQNQAGSTKSLSTGGILGTLRNTDTAIGRSAANFARFFANIGNGWRAASTGGRVLVGLGNDIDRGLSVVPEDVKKIDRSLSSTQSTAQKVISVFGKMGDAAANAGSKGVEFFNTGFRVPLALLIPLVGAIVSAINPLVGLLGAAGAAALGFANSLGTLASVGAAIPGILSAIAGAAATIKIGIGGIFSGGLTGGQGVLGAYTNLQNAKLTAAAKGGGGGGGGGASNAVTADQKASTLASDRSTLFSDRWGLQSDKNTIQGGKQTVTDDGRSLRDNALQIQQDRLQIGDDKSTISSDKQQIQQDSLDISQDKTNITRDKQDIGWAKTQLGQTYINVAQAMQKAEHDVVTAQQNAVAAQKNLTDARAQALAQLVALNKEVQRAQQYQDAANASAQLAKENLDNVLADPTATVGQKEEARAQLEAAQSNVQDVADQNKANKDQLDQINKNGGVEGMDQVVQAKQQLADAQKAVVDAEIALQQEKQNGPRQILEAQRAVQDAEAKLVADQMKQRSDERKAIDDKRKISEDELKLIGDRNKLNDDEANTARLQEKLQWDRKVLIHDEQQLVQDQLKYAQDLKQYAKDQKLPVKSGSGSSGGGGGPSAVDTAQAQLNAALAKLAPAARTVLEDIFAMVPAWEKMRKEVQQDLFAPLIPQMKNLKNFIPQIYGILDPIAEALGNFFAKTIAFVTSPAEVKNLKQIGKDSGTILTLLGDGFLALARAWSDFTVAAGPFTKWLVGGVVKGVEQFAKAVSGASKDGSLASWLKGAQSTISQWWTVFSNVFSGILGYIKAAKPIGDYLLGGLVKWSANFAQAGKNAGPAWDKWFKKDGLKTVLGDVAKIFHDFFTWFGKTATDPKTMSSLDGILKTIDKLGKPLKSLFDTASSSGVAQKVLQFVVDFLTHLADFAPQVFQAVGVFLDVLTTTLNILAGILDLPGIRQLAGFILVVGGVGALLGMSKFFVLAGWLVTIARLAFPWIPALVSLLAGITKIVASGALDVLGRIIPGKTGAKLRETAKNIENHRVDKLPSDRNRYKTAALRDKRILEARKKPGSLGAVKKAKEKLDTTDAELKSLKSERAALKGQQTALAKVKIPRPSWMSEFGKIRIPTPGWLSKLLGALGGGGGSAGKHAASAAERIKNTLHKLKSEDRGSITLERAPSRHRAPGEPKRGMTATELKRLGTTAKAGLSATSKIATLDGLDKVGEKVGRAGDISLVYDGIASMFHLPLLGDMLPGGSTTMNLMSMTPLAPKGLRRVLGKPKVGGDAKAVERVIADAGRPDTWLSKIGDKVGSLVQSSSKSGTFFQRAGKALSGDTGGIGGIADLFKGALKTGTVKGAFDIAGKSGLGAIGKVAGKLLPVVGAGLGGWDLYNQWNDTLNPDKETKKKQREFAEMNKKGDTGGMLGALGNNMWRSAVNDAGDGWGIAGPWGALAGGVEGLIRGGVQTAGPKNFWDNGKKGKEAAGIANGNSWAHGWQQMFGGGTDKDTKNGFFGDIGHGLFGGGGKGGKGKGFFGDLFGGGGKGGKGAGMFGDIGAGLFGGGGKGGKGAGMFGDIGKTVSGAFKGVGKWFSDAAKGIGKFFKPVTDFFKNAAKGIAHFFSPIVTAFKGAAKIAGQIWKSVQKIFSAAGAALGRIWQKYVVAPFTKVVAFIEKAWQKYVVTPFQKTVAFIEKAWNKYVVAPFMKTVAFIEKAWNKYVVAPFMKTVAFIEKAWQKYVVEPFLKFVAFIEKAWNKYVVAPFLKFVANIEKAWNKYVVAPFEKVVSLLQTGWNKYVVGGFQTAVKNISNWWNKDVVGTFQRIAKNIGDWWNKGVVKGFNGVIKFLSDTWNNWVVKPISQILHGVWQTITNINSTIQGVVNAISGIVSSVSGGIVGFLSHLGRSTGGPIPEYHASGGVSGRFQMSPTSPLTKGTDTVPTMLTPGEFVLRKAAVEVLGMNNLEEMNAHPEAWRGIIARGKNEDHEPQGNHWGWRRGGQGSGRVPVDSPIMEHRKHPMEGAVSFFQNGGLVRDPGFFHQQYSDMAGAGCTSPGGGSTVHDRSITIEKLEIMNPVPERSTQSLSRQLRRMAKFGSNG